MGCDQQANPQAVKVLAVSIHAPVWGATCDKDREMGFDDVSIHAPVWGATYVSRLLLDGVGFQSTHPCGVRQSVSR